MSGVSPASPQKNTSVSRFFWLLMGIMLVFAAFCFYKPSARGYSVFNRTWGFDHITFYSATWQIIFFVVAFLLIFPLTNGLLVKALSAMVNKLAGLRKIKILLFLLTGLLSIGCFYLLKNKYFFLGDFNLRLEQIMRKEVLNTEYLTMKLLYYCARLGERYGYTPYQAFEWYSCAAGGVFVFFSCLIADLCGQNPLQKLFYLVAQLSSALLLVFCGYIEVYSTPVALLAVYLYLGLRYLKYKKGFYLLILCLGVAIASHLLCVAVLPSLFILWYFNHKPAVIASMKNTRIATSIAVLIVLALLYILKSHNSFVLPLTPPTKTPNYMTFFSFQHFWESFNGQLLVCGLSLIFMAIALRKIIRDKIALSGSVYFLLSTSGTMMLIVLLANLHRGSCDWDIMAFTAISLNLLTAMLLVAAYKNTSSLHNYLLAATFGLNALHAGLWLHIQHTDKSIRKVESMLTKDPGTYYVAKLPPMIQLVMLYRANNLWAEAERAAFKACDNYNVMAGCVCYGSVLVEEKKRDQAARFFENLLQRSVFVPEAYMFLLEYYETGKQPEKMAKYMNMLYDAFILQPDYFMAKIKAPVYQNMFSYLYNIEAPKQDQKRLASIAATVQRLSTLTPQSKK